METQLIAKELQTRYRDEVDKGPVDAFVHALRSMDKRLKGERIRLVILVDESEQILAVDWSDDLRPNLRALLSDSPIVEDVALVMAGSTHMYTKVTERDSPLENILDRYLLPLLSREATLKLARWPNDNRLSEDAAEEVWHQTGGHPCLAQYILHELWDELEDATADDVREVAETFDERTRHFSTWSGTLGRTGNNVYRWLGKQDTPATFAMIRQHFSKMMGTTLQSTLDALCYHGLVRQTGHGRGRCFQVAGQAYHNWFMTNVAERVEHSAVERLKISAEQPTPAIPVSLATHKLATLIRRREAGDLPYTLLLGSSLSLTPEVRQAVCGSDDWQAFWTAMERLSAAERRALLADPLDALNLTAGYRCLAQLVQAGYFDLVLTLNVDDALDESLRILSTREYQIFTHGQVLGTEIAVALGRTHPRVKAVKLRGDINAYKLPLTPEGQFEFPKALEEAVERLLSQDTILVGDISSDTDIQRCIRQGDGALWVVVPEEPRSGSFLYNTKRARPKGEVITGPEAEFGSFFSALARELGVEI